MKVKINSKIYHNKDRDYEALNHINIEFIHKGFVSIIGDSGSGKTTLLNIISGEDHDFEGVVDNPKNISYIKQEIELLDYLSVKSHLSMVCKDHNKIEEVCERLHIKELLNKKIKLLSLGQKRRIQIACAIMNPVSYLICDEPTASLDEENAKTILQLLKELSLHMCVIVVTHDIEKANDYSDRILYIEEGCIVKEELLKETALLGIEHSEHTCLKEHMLILTSKIMYSRFFETISYFFLCLLITFSLIIGTQFFAHANANQQKKDIWYTGDNVFMSQPHKVVEDKYDVYQIYYQKQLNNIKNASDDIIGYEWGWNADLYDYFPTEQEYKEGYEYRKFFVDAFKKIVEDNGYFIYYSPFLPYVGTDKDYYGPNKARIFQMFNFEPLTLSIGEYPKNTNEVIVDYGYAKYLSNKFGYADVNEIIGKSITLYMYIGDANLLDQTKMNVTITGITELTSQVSYRIYTKAKDYDKALYEVFDFKTSDPGHVYLNLLAKDSSDETLDILNSVLGSEDESFVRASEYTVPMQEVESYRNPVQFYLYAAIIYTVLLIAFLIIECILQRRNQKEKLILQRYGYSYEHIRMLMLGILFILVLLLLTGSVQELNRMLKDDFFQIRFAHVILSCLINYFLCYSCIKIALRKK